MLSKTARRKRIRALAEETFGDAEKADRWLRRPLSVLNNQAPLELAQTEAGEPIVKNMLARIAWGAAM